MKNSNLILALLIITISGILLLLSCDDSSKVKHGYNGSGYILSPEEFSKIDDGDIIMRQGYGIVSSIILKTLNEEIPVSHIGIISRGGTGDYYVIHSVSRAISDFDGIQIDKLDEFINKSRPGSIIITRYNSAKSDDNYPGKQISDRARYYLDKNIPFDHSFNFEDTTSFFCSELVWRILIDLFDDDVFDSYPTDNLIKKLKFEPFYDTTRFETIVNHHNP